MNKFILAFAIALVLTYSTAFRISTKGGDKCEDRWVDWVGDDEDCSCAPNPPPKPDDCDKCKDKCDCKDKHDDKCDDKCDHKDDHKCDDKCDDKCDKHDDKCGCDDKPQCREWDTCDDCDIDREAIYVELEEIKESLTIIYNNLDYDW